MCRMVLGFTSKPTQMMHTFFNDWEKGQPDGFGYYVRTSKHNEYMLKSPRNDKFKMRRGVKTFMLHCRLKTSGYTVTNGNGEENHPFISEDKTLLLTHNGYLMGYKSLKKHLRKGFGHKFASVVDSEVLLHLFENYYKKWGISYKSVSKWLSTLNKFNVSGQMNVIVYDRINFRWFAFSEGSIVVIKPVYSKDLFIASDARPIKDTPVFTFELPSGHYVLGTKNKIEDIGKIGNLGTHYNYKAVNSNIVKYRKPKRYAEYDEYVYNERQWNRLYGVGMGRGIGDW